MPRTLIINVENVSFEKKAIQGTNKVWYKIIPENHQKRITKLMIGKKIPITLDDKGNIIDMGQYLGDSKQEAIKLEEIKPINKTNIESFKLTTTKKMSLNDLTLISNKLKELDYIGSITSGGNVIFEKENSNV